MSDLVPEQPRRKFARTPEAKREIVLFTETLIAQNLHKGEILAALKAKTGYSTRNCERFRVEAYKQINARYEKHRDAMRAESAVDLQQLAHDPRFRPVDRIRAHEALAKLYGLNAPEQQQISGPDGSPVPLTVMVAAIQQAKQSPPALED